MPITSSILYLVLWGACNAPAVYFAAYNGFILSNDKPPCKVAVVKRAIPEQPWYLQFAFSTAISSLIIFSTVICEFHYVLTSVWRSQVIGMFIFMFLNVNMMICIVALVSIINTYLSLRAGNWAWWWRSFYLGFGVGGWVAIYCFYMMECEFQISSLASDLVFILYALLLSQLFGLMCAAISCISSWFFVTMLYLQSKSD